MTEREVWKDIEGYEGIYQVSSFGRVKSFKGGREKFLKVALKTNYVALCGEPTNAPKAYMVHRLVAIAFIPNPENKPEVNHKDFNRSNNNVNNLEWNTRRENLEHFYNSDRRLLTVGINSYHAKITESAVHHIRERKMPVRKYGKLYGIHNATVSKIQLRQIWKHI